MTDWEETLDKYSQMIQNQFTNILATEKKSAHSYHSFIGRVYDDLSKYLTRKGKRLASCSTLLIYNGYNKIIDEKILNIGVGIELYRHAILVHDDLVDNDEIRRGEPTIHKIYSKEYDTRFGNGAAVFIGNILNNLALKYLLKSGFGLKKTIAIVSLLNTVSQEVNESQTLDLLFEYTNPNVNEWYIMASKRAASLFKASILIGAILADAPENDIQLLQKAAEQIGYCFDIQDDIIDTYASKEQYGRRSGGDLLKNKKPLYIVYTYQLATQQQLKAMKYAIVNHPNDLTIIKKIIVDCGALDAAKNRSREHANSAKKLISKTHMNTEIKKFFITFIDYIKDSLNWYK